MKRLLLLLVACKSEPPPRAVAKPALGFVAEIRAEATLVTGTRRFALRVGREGWYVDEDGKLVDKPELGAAIARTESELGGVVDVLYAATPVVVGGKEHHEKHVKLVPGPIEVPLDGLAKKITMTSLTSEAWLFEHELQTGIALVSGTTVEIAPSLERIGPDTNEASPVSRRLCRHPKIADIAWRFALVTECSDDAPIRIVEIDGIERKLPSRAELRGFRPEAIAVTRSGHLVLAGVRESYLALYRVEADAEVTIHLDNISRVVSAVVDDDDRIWTLALDAKGYVLARDGERLVLANRQGIVLEPKALGLDDTLGAVVLASDNRANWLLASRPFGGDPITIVR